MDAVPTLTSPNSFSAPRFRVYLPHSNHYRSKTTVRCATAAIYSSAFFLTLYRRSLWVLNAGDHRDASFTLRSSHNLVTLYRGAVTAWTNLTILAMLVFIIA